MINYKSENKNVREVQCNHTPHSTHSTQAKRVAFTLAEVLITLAIIGIVAAVTIPTLITKYQEKQTVTRFKWIYSTLANAFTMAVAENGAPETWDLNSAEDMANILSKYMRVSEKCHYKKGCMSDNIKVVSLNGATRYNYLGSLASYVKEKFSNGIVLLYTSVNNNCTYNYIDDMGNTRVMTNNCGTIYAFISMNVTNRLGLDNFAFVVTRNGILPSGHNYKDDEVRQFCTKNWTSEDNINGSTCGEWIRRWNNADYWYDN